MFLLPIDQKLNDVQTPVGKVEQVSWWNLTVTIEPGVLQNEEHWSPGSDHPHFHKYEILAEICFGNQRLLQTRLDCNQIVFSKNFPDTPIPTRQNLIIKLSGKPEAPDLEDNAHVIIKINCTVENLSIMPVFETLGYYQIDSTQEKKAAGEFLGENGQQVLEIYTPIYVWLLENQNSIDQFYQKH